MPTADDARELALALPEAVEQETWGHPTFRVRKKMFGTLATDGATATMTAPKTVVRAFDDAVDPDA